MKEDKEQQLSFPPDVIFTAENKKRFGNLPKYVALAGLSALSSSALLYGGIKIGNLIGKHTTPDLSPDLPINSENKNSIDKLEDYYNDIKKGGNIEQFRNNLIRDYLTAKDSFLNFSNYLLVTENSEDNQKFIREGRLDLVFDGADLLKRVTRQSIDIDRDSKSISYLNLNFDLNNTYQLFLIERIISENLELNNTELGGLFNLQHQENIDDLIWLAYANLPIEFEEFAVSYPQDNILIQTARFYRKIKQLGYQTDSKIVFTRHKEGGSVGWFDPDTKFRYITEKASPETIFHEEGHYQAKVNPKFSQDKFNQIFLEADGSFKPGAFSVNSFVNPNYQLSRDSIDSTLKEAYADTIKKYYSDGIDFRRVLKELYLSNDPAFPIIKAQYDFGQSFFGGEEYLELGEIYDPKSNDIFTISFPAPDQNGIKLASEPTLEENYLEHKVFDSDIVVILENPKEVPLLKNMSGGWEKIRMVKVEVTNPDTEDFGKQQENPKIGWIWDLWLGDKIGGRSSDSDFQK